MKLLVLSFKINGGTEAPVAMRSEVLDMPDTYDIVADSIHGRFDILRKAFAKQVKENGFYDVERDRWKDPMNIRIGSVSRID